MSFLRIFITFLVLSFSVSSVYAANNLVCKNLQDVVGGNPGGILWAPNSLIDNIMITSTNGIDWDFSIYAVTDPSTVAAQGQIIPQEVVVSSGQADEEMIEIASELLLIDANRISSYQVFELSDQADDATGMSVVRFYEILSDGTNSELGVIYFIGWGFGKCS